MGIVCSFIFLYENRSVQQQQVPKVRFYFLPFLILTGFGFFLVVNSLNFLYYASDVEKQLTGDCKSTVQDFSADYIN